MKTEKTVILDMTKFGIKTLVGAKQKKIDFYLTSYRTQPDSRFGGGVGKKQLMTYTYNFLIGILRLLKATLNAGLIFLKTALSTPHYSHI